MSDVVAAGSPAEVVSPEFVVTKEHRRFVEFCEACRRARYIGLCYGAPGVGKTLSARRYARWDLVEALAPYLNYAGWQERLAPALAECHAVFVTAPVVNTPQLVDREVRLLRRYVNQLQPEAPAQLQPLGPTGPVGPAWTLIDRVDLLIVDEADRLKVPSLEQLRDLYDRGRLGLVLVGMPGIEKRLARYAQLYSRVGFVHHFRPLGEDEVRFILEQRWREFGLTFSPADFTDAEAMAAVLRVTGGNFRLLERLLTEVGRLLRINQLRVVTKEVVETARESLMVGVA